MHNKYFNFITRERQLNQDFQKELETNPLALAEETANFFRESGEIGEVKMSRHQCTRLALLLDVLLHDPKETT